MTIKQFPAVITGVAGMLNAVPPRSCHIMSHSSSRKKHSRSGRSGSSRKTSNLGISTQTPSSNSGDIQPGDYQWSEWEWDSERQLEWRGRNTNGNWEYEKRARNEQRTPRSLPSPGQELESSEQLQVPGHDNYVLQNQVTTSYGVPSPGTSMPMRTRRFDIDIPPEAPYDSLASLPSRRSMVDSEGYPTYSINENIYDAEDNGDPPQTFNTSQESEDSSGKSRGLDTATYTQNQTDITGLLPHSTIRFAPSSSTTSGNMHSLNQLVHAQYATNQGSDQSAWGYQPGAHIPYQQTRRRGSSSTKSDHQINAAGPAGERQEKNLNKGFKVHHESDFHIGKIFKILWTEPEGQVNANNGKTKGTEPAPTKFNERHYSSIRRFVIVNAMKGHCLCLPILTYGNQATTKPGVKPQDHAIIYTLDKTGRPPTEVEGEEKLSKKCIRMEPKTQRDQLHEFSRLNYAKIYTVEYNVKQQRLPTRKVRRLRTEIK